MIDKVSIQSFKSIEDLEVNLGCINVFIGANGSGKSNILEAIGVLSAAASGRVDDEALLRRGVRPGVPQLYKCAFSGTRRSPHIYLKASGDSAKFEVALHNPLSDPPNPAWHYKTEVWECGEERIVSRSPATKSKFNPEAGLAALKAADRPINDPAVVLLNALRDYAIFSPNTPALRGIVSEAQPRKPLGLSGGGLPDAVHYLLKNKNRNFFQEGIREIRGLIDWAKAFGSAPAESMPLSPSAAASQRVVRFRDKFMAEGRNILSGYDASEGALYVLFMAILAIDDRAPALFSIDNADHGLNPRLARELMRRFCKLVLGNPKPRQVLLTTHNPLALDGLPLKDDRVRLFSVSRTNSGRTVAALVKIDQTIIDKAEKEGSLSRLWVMGHLGGVPNV